MEKLLIAGLENKTGWLTARRLAAERRWITKLKTQVPNGLNEI